MVYTKSQEEYNKAVDDAFPSIPGLVTPTKFGETIQLKDGGSLTEVIDAPARKAIATPVVLYMQESLKGTDCSDLFYIHLQMYYGEENVTYTEVKAKDDAYNQKWVRRSLTIDYPNIVVVKVNGSNPARYLVTVPFSFKMVDKDGKVRKGTSTTIAAVQPDRYNDSKRPAYFIISIGDAGKKTN
jgi:hypothetical protein